jgi:hypothetical protein
MTAEIWDTIRRLKAEIAQEQYKAREEINHIRENLRDEERRVSRECYMRTRELERQVEALSKVLADIYSREPLPPVTITSSTGA